MTIIDPPVKSTENFYTNNKNFVYERRSPAVQSIEPDVITLTEKESVYTIDEEDPYSIKVSMQNTIQMIAALTFIFLAYTLE